MRLTAGRARATRVGALLPPGLLVLVLAAVLPVGDAHAAEYRYWSYWHGTSGSWTYGSTGPAGYAVDDGDVEGWRMSVSRDGQSPPPRAAAGSATFAKICGSRTAGQGQVRVAVVLDFGVTADARPGDRTPSPSVQGRCAVIDAGSTGAQALSAVASLRVEKGLVCGVDGYPSRGCGEAVAPAPAPTTTKPAPRPSAPSSASAPPTRRSTPPPAGAGGSASTTATNPTTASTGAAGGASPPTTATPATAPPATSASPTSRRTPMTSGTTAAVTPGSEPTPGLAVTAADRGGSGGSWTGLAVAGVIVIALAGGAVVTARRRRP